MKRILLILICLVSFIKLQAQDNVFIQKIEGDTFLVEVSKVYCFATPEDVFGNKNYGRVFTDNILYEIKGNSNVLWDANNFCKYMVENYNLNKSAIAHLQYLITLIKNHQKYIQNY